MKRLNLVAWIQVYLFSFAQFLVKQDSNDLASKS